VSKPIILIVEDEPLLRMHAVALIEDAGFDTLEARSAEEAIDLLEKRLDIRIVFTDIDLPGEMDGIKLAAAIRDRWPPVELVLTSGQVKVAAEDIPERGHFLAKPYDATRLIETLQSFG
jgi:CheY-like chemotaxis protein